MEIDHIGYAVKKIDKARETLEKLGFQFEMTTDDTDRNLKIVFGKKDGYRIELISPMDKSKESPADIYLNKVGPTPYHICYRSDNMERDMEELKRQGFRVVIEPEEAIALDGRRVVFMASLAVGMIEIVEK